MCVVCMSGVCVCGVFVINILCLWSMHVWCGWLDVCCDVLFVYGFYTYVVYVT